MLRKLTAPFAAGEVKFKPQVVQGNRALALAYIDARAVQDRLDDVLGVVNWQDEYNVLPDGNVVCRLKLRFDGEWLSRMDVGGPSEQPDGGDRMKAAFSDALKRAAVKYGIGRYIHQASQQWVDYDPVKRQFKGTPALPKYKPPVRATGGNPPAAQPAAETAVATLQQPEARRALPAEPRCTQEQVDEMTDLCVQLGKDAAWLANSLGTKFGKVEPAQLTPQEATKVVAGLKTQVEKGGNKKGQTGRKTAARSNGTPAESGGAY